MTLPAERAAPGRPAAGRALGPAAVQRQGERLQGLVPAGPALARLRGGGAAVRSRTGPGAWDIHRRPAGGSRCRWSPGGRCARCTAGTRCPAACSAPRSPWPPTEARRTRGDVDRRRHRPGAEQRRDRCRCSGWASGRSRTAGRPSRRCGGRWRPATGTSTRPRSTATSARSAARSGTAGCRGTQLFVATKFHPRDPDPERAVEASLRLLGLDHVDLYLWHWPSGSATRHWPAFERIAARGLARAVGVSNFSADQLARLARRGRAADGRPGRVQPVPVPAGAAGGVRGERGRAGGVQPADPRARPRAPGDRARSRGGTGGRRPRCCCAGRCSGRSRSSRSPRTGTASSRTPRIFDFALPAADMAALDGLDRTGGTAEA